MIEKTSEELSHRCEAVLLDLAIIVSKSFDFEVVSKIRFNISKVSPFSTHVRIREKKSFHKPIMVNI